MLRALASLVKPRIVGLLTLTGLAALGAAGGATASTTAAFAVAGALIAAGSAAMNCWYDRDLDREMERTAGRPLPSGDLDHRVALAFAVGLVAAGSAVGLATLPTVTVVYMWLGAAAYAGLYTVALKRRHWLGVVLGGSAGSFPVLAGWTAVRPVAPAAVLLAVLVFAWTPAHAWALAYVYRDDFAAAGVPTLPAVTDGATVRRATWHWALATVAVGLLVVPLAGPLYLGGLLAGAPALLAAFHEFRVRGDEATATRAFFTSNAVLAALFLAWAADGLVSAGAAAGVVAGAAGTVAVVAWTWGARPSLRGVRAAESPALAVLSSGAGALRAGVVEALE
jgi:protoheme IX farnesyltransferase